MRRSRRTSRIPDSHPGLFDSIETAGEADDFGISDIVADTVQRLREKAAEARDLADDDLSLAAADDEAAQRSERLMFVSFGSGSSGNCAFIGTRSGGVLIDAGVDAPTVMRRLQENGIDFDRQVLGIIVTHDHSDHVRAAYPLLRRHLEKRLWATPKTLTGILRRHNISRRIKDYHQPIYKEFEFNVGPLAITPFETSHDGTDNVGFSIRCAGETFVVATDMGYATERALHYMSRASVLMVESNYDAEMLANGPYPQYLQARIRGERGHMDNTATAAHLARIWAPGMHHVMLCHLSHDNNTPELALSSVAEGLMQAGAILAPAHAVRTPGHVHLYALPRFDASPLFVF